MFLLLLMGLGAASVKAQVRIGGNAAPNSAVVLDLNATDTTMNGTKGLALPRLSLSSNTTLLAGTANLAGMLVYNTGGTLPAGIYFWDGTTWTVLMTSATVPRWQVTFDGNVNIPAMAAMGLGRASASGVAPTDFCSLVDPTAFLVHAEANDVFVFNSQNASIPATTKRLICYGSR